MDKDVSYSIFVKKDGAGWEFEGSYPEYVDCIMQATDLHDKGFKVKVFDPYMGKDFEFPEQF